MPDRQPRQSDRQSWLSILAHADVADLERQWADLQDKPAYQVLRPAEVGLAMVRGRAGGTGQPFNLGEMTVTRCAVRLDGVTGFGYATGRDRRKAELIAVLDALLQGEAHGPGLRKTLLPALEAKRSAARRAKAEKVGGSKVDFFTMVRGEG